LREQKFDQEIKAKFILQLPTNIHSLKLLTITNDNEKDSRPKEIYRIAEDSRFIYFKSQSETFYLTLKLIIKEKNLAFW
jgi:hypothetical protein